ncbi:C-type lectin domain family 10 member A-like isoform X2 [Cetorhinus maximus]
MEPGPCSIKHISGNINMSQLSLYENLESFAMKDQQGNKGRVKPQVEAEPNVETHRRRNILLLISGLLCSCVFLSFVFLLVGLLKISAMYVEMNQLQENLQLEFAQFKNNVSEEVDRSHSDIAGELSKMKIKGCSCIQCPVNWREFNQACYYFSTQNGNWQFAKQQCSLKNSHLLVISSALEQGFIKKEASSNFYWIGLNDLVTEKKWQWVDGTTYGLSPTFWAAGEPNNRNGENCVHIDDKGRWNDIKCSTNFLWICEKQKNSA